jgi:hypothetical protein
MDIQDLQDNRPADLQFVEITERKSSAVHSKSTMNWERGFLNQFMRKPLQSLSGKRDSKCNASILRNLSAN